MNKFHAGIAKVAMAAMLLAGAAVAQNAGAVQGTVVDEKGGLIAGASVTLRNESTGKTAAATADAAGHFSMSGLAPGSYDVLASGTGFKVLNRKGVQVGATNAAPLALTLAVQDATDQVTVDANATHSIAAALAPMDALLDETSARTEITSQFIQNFTSPLADYGEAVEMAPGTFTTNSNGIGLGQSKTYFRGFPDGDYDIDFDGLPFYDTNTPTHHSWAFFPTQWLGGIDFDRSPGTASTIGPTPFGGSIHLLSRELSPVQNFRAQVAYGSFGTMLADAQYDSGALGAGRKAFVFVDAQHMDSKGYETNNFQNRNAGSIKTEYKFSEKTTLTGFAGGGVAGCEYAELQRDPLPAVWAVDERLLHLHHGDGRVCGNVAVYGRGYQFLPGPGKRYVQWVELRLQPLPCAHGLRVRWV